MLPFPNDPRIYEPYMRSALEYVELAETVNGPIPRPVDFAYIWGDALEELERKAPDVRIVNLETSVTTSEDWIDKGINYRMHPGNIRCISAAKIDCCALANNHVLDWGYSGLVETLETLRKVNVKSVGAGRNIKDAKTPVMMEVSRKGRVIMFSLGSVTSGIPPEWAASEDKPGVNLLEDLSDRTVSHIGEIVRKVKGPKDTVAVSVHWGENWGYEIFHGHREFAHKLVDEAGVDVIHGHSSHHAKGIEVYKEKPILYGCGDFLNDYEGISGYEEFRDDLALMYFVSMDPSTRKLIRFEMTPLQIRRFQLNRISREDAQWLRHTLEREGRKLGTQVDLNEDNTLTLRWQ